MDGSRALRKGDDGVWSVTVGPIAPEVYEYEFMIDGETFLEQHTPPRAFPMRTDLPRPEGVPRSH